MPSLLLCAGALPHALHAHPNREHIVYPLGSQVCSLCVCRDHYRYKLSHALEQVVVERISGKKAQSFLTGLTTDVSCIAVSPSGRYVAAGQITHMGFPVSASHMYLLLSLQFTSLFAAG